MNKPETYIVNRHDMRSNPKDGTCFYCSAKLGMEHDKECVVREKTVVVEYTIRVCRRVPESWNQNNVEFHQNESGFCMNNVIDALKELVDAETSAGPCMCENIVCKFIREASSEDENKYRVM